MCQWDSWCGGGSRYCLRYHLGYSRAPRTFKHVRCFSVLSMPTLFTPLAAWSARADLRWISPFFVLGLAVTSNTEHQARNDQQRQTDYQGTVSLNKTKGFVVVHYNKGILQLQEYCPLLACLVGLSHIVFLDYTGVLKLVICHKICFVWALDKMYAP